MTRMRRQEALFYSFVLFACFVVPLIGMPFSATAADLFIGSGVKAGEITDTTAIVLVRLTSTAGPKCERA